jgi:hypothetical protein
MSNEPLPLAFVFARFLFSLGLVLATYNPTGYSFYHWIADLTAGPLSVKVFVALILVMIYYAIFRVVIAAFRRSGLIVGGLAGVLLAVELASVVAASRSERSWHFYILLSQYAALCAIAIVLSVGVSWSQLIERLTGQLQKRYVQR